MVVNFNGLNYALARTRGYLILFIIMFMAKPTNAQLPVDIGVQGYFNFASLSHGLGVRAPINLSDKAEVVPIFNYTLPSSDIQELSAMLFGHYAVINNFEVKQNRVAAPVVYLIGGAGYLKWINYVPFATNSKAVADNFVINLGAGVNYPLNSKIALFADVKLNPVWMESYTEIGLRFKASKRRNKALDCPKIL